PIYPTGGYDPITIGAVSRAIDELIPNAAKRPEKLSEALELAAEKTKRLTQVAKDPNSVRPQIWRNCGSTVSLYRKALPNRNGLRMRTIRVIVSGDDRGRPFPRIRSKEACGIPRGNETCR